MKTLNKIGLWFAKAMVPVIAGLLVIALLYFTGLLTGPRGLQGPKGDPGIGQTGPAGKDGIGIQGLQGVAGKDGKDGKDGKNGVDGKDGAPAPITSNDEIRKIVREEVNAMFAGKTVSITNSLRNDAIGVDGMYYISMTVSVVGSKTGQQLDAVVDTGASMTTIPMPAFTMAGITETGKVTFTVANGSLMVCSVGMARVQAFGSLNSVVEVAGCPSSTVLLGQNWLNSYDVSISGGDTIVVKAKEPAQAAPTPDQIVITTTPKLTTTAQVAECKLADGDLAIAHQTVRVLGADPCAISFEWEVVAPDGGVSLWGTYVGQVTRTFVFDGNVRGTVWRLPNGYDLMKYSEMVRDARISGYEQLGGVPPELPGMQAMPAARILDRTKSSVAAAPAAAPAPMACITSVDLAKQKGWQVANPNADAKYGGVQVVLPKGAVLPLEWEMTGAVGTKPADGGFFNLYPPQRCRAALGLQ